MEQEGKRHFGQQDVMVPWKIEQDAIAEENSSRGGKKPQGSDQIFEALPPTEEVKGSKTYKVYQRYYHVFKKGELSSLLLDCKNVSVEDEVYDHDNWVSYGTKL